MQKKTLKITGITEGRATNRYAPRSGEFTSSAGIDPDQALSGQYSPSGFAVPTAYTQFSGANMTAFAVAVITTPYVTDRIYVVLSNGRILRYNQDFSNETLVGTVAGGNAGGAAYYNNYIYVFGTGASKDDVSRYGPLSGVPAITDAWWSGLGLTPLTNTTYPLVQLVRIPNHYGFVHSDNSLYFCDFAGGQGIINRINTVAGTVPGEVDNPNVPSAYGVLDLPLGYYPSALCSYSTSVAVVAFQKIDDFAGQVSGPAAVFLWDPTNEVSFDQFINLPDPLATAAVQRNGRLTVFSGNILRGCRASEYVGGSTFREVLYIPDSVPPFAGAVDMQGERVYFGSNCIEPVSSAAVFATGSKVSASKRDVQNVAVVGSQNVNFDKLVTALRIISQQQISNPQLAFGTAIAETYAMYRKTTGGTGTIGSVWETPYVTVGEKFRIDRIRIPLGTEVSSGTKIQVTVNYDDGTTSAVPLFINSTNQPGVRRVTFKTPQITGSGQNNFCLRFDHFEATSATAVAFPITVDIEVFDDEKLYE